MTREFMNDSQFVAGAEAALEGFRTELIQDRGRIENEDEPVFDVIIDLLDRVLTVLRQNHA